MASTSCPRCGAWTVGFKYDLTTGEIVWYCLACGHRWRRDVNDTDRGWDEVTQTILHDPDRPDVYGNCLQAAVASVLRLPLEAVPHFAQFTWWPASMELYVRQHGLTCKGERTATIPDRLCIVGGKSPRGVAHSVVGYGGQVVWDPHPSRDGLVSIRDVTWFEASGVGDACWFCKHPWVLDQTEPA